MDANFNQKGLKNLLLSNDFGALDASKPFMPFGGQPNKDTSLVIGHKEIFSKKNAAVTLNIEWAGLPANAYNIKYDANNSATYPNVQWGVPGVMPAFLESGIWESESLGNTAILMAQTVKYRSLQKPSQYLQPVSHPTKRNMITWVLKR
jgi:hypothetical protein